MTPPTDTSSRKRAVVRELAVAWLHLAVLWMFAFARPLFQVLEDSPEFFVARGNTTADIVLLALGVAFVPPSLLVLCEALLFPWRRARQVLHLVFVVVLLAAIVLQALDGLASGPAWLLIVVSLGIGAAGAWAYSRTRLAPAMLTVLSPAPVLIVIYFLLLSPVSDLVLPQDVEAAGSGQGGSSTPVVFVVFDEFSGASLADGSGRVDASRFPNLAAFSADSTWYRNATTVADQTTNAVPALSGGETAREGEAARRRGLSGQPVHGSRGQPFAQRRRAGQRSLPAAAVLSGQPAPAQPAALARRRPQRGLRLSASAGRSRGRIAGGRSDVRPLPRGRT